MQRLDQAVAGVGDRGRAGVRDQHDLGAALDRLRELARAVRLVPLVVRDQPRPRRGRAARTGGPCGGCPRRPRRRPPPARGAARSLRSSRFPIGVGQTMRRPGISGLLWSCFERHGRGTDHARFGAELGGHHAASGSSVAARGRAAPPARAPRAARRPPSRRRRARSRRARTRSRGRSARPRSGGRSAQRRRAPPASPAIAAVVAARPSTLSPAAIRSPERRIRVGLCGRRAPRCRGRCRRRPPRRSRGSGSCPGSAARRRRSRCGRARRPRRSSRGRPRRSRIRPPPIPVPIVSSTAFVAPRAAPQRCSASAATLPSLSISTGQAQSLGHQVADRHVDDREVHRADREAALAVDRAGDPQPDRRGPPDALRAPCEARLRACPAARPRSAPRLARLGAVMDHRTLARRRPRASSSRPGRRRSRRASRPSQMKVPRPSASISSEWLPTTRANGPNRPITRSTDRADGFSSAGPRFAARKGAPGAAARSPRRRRPASREPGARAAGRPWLKWVGIAHRRLAPPEPRSRSRSRPRSRSRSSPTWATRWTATR